MMVMAAGWFIIDVAAEVSWMPRKVFSTSDVLLLKWMQLIIKVENIFDQKMVSCHLVEGMRPTYLCHWSSIARYLSEVLFCLVQEKKGLWALS